MFRFSTCTLSFALVLISCRANVNEIKKSRVAIVGGGIGGTTVAYELSQLGFKLNYHDIEIDLFEQKNVGGRLATVTLNGLEFESGGSIIHASNRYMSAYVAKFNLTKRPHSIDDDIEHEQDIFSLFDGTKIVFTESEYLMLTTFRLALRYGIIPPLFNTINVMRTLVKFSRIYRLQNLDVPFHNVYQLLLAADIDLYTMTNVTLKDYLDQIYYSDSFINEYAFLATNINYNQDVDNVHAFVGEVSLAGAAESSLWSVSGGNKRVPEALLKYSGAKLIQERVSAIRLTSTSQYALECGNVTRKYDFVIIACPQIESQQNIKLLGIPNTHLIPIKYQRTVATFVHGELNYTYFDYGSSAKPNQIFSVNKSLFFNSISMVYPVTPNKGYDHRVFKVFSKENLSNEQLNLLFSKIYNVVVEDWYAYPVYSTNMSQIPFVIYENLFYLNSIELAASAMEMSVISGRNIAMHVLKRLRQ